MSRRAPRRRPRGRRRCRLRAVVPLRVELLGKGFRESGLRAGISQDAITLVLGFTNDTGVDIVTFAGRLGFRDLQGGEVDSATLMISAPIPAGGRLEWSGELGYDDFRESHRRLRDMELGSLVVGFAPRTVVFADGRPGELD